MTGRSCRGFPAAGARTPSPGLGTQQGGGTLAAHVWPRWHLVLWFSAVTAAGIAGKGGLGPGPADPSPVDPIELGTGRLFPCLSSSTELRRCLCCCSSSSFHLPLVVPSCSCVRRTSWAGRELRVLPSFAAAPPSASHHGVMFSRLSVPRWVAEPGWHRCRRARREHDRWERGRLTLPVPG